MFCIWEVLRLGTFCSWVLYWILFFLGRFVGVPFLATESRILVEFRRKQNPLRFCLIIVLFIRQGFQADGTVWCFFILIV
jgi:hypothetical protein